MYWIGRGQLALCEIIEGPRCGGGLSRPHLLDMAEQGVEVINWNLCNSEQPFVATFDFRFCLCLRASADPWLDRTREHRKRSATGRLHDLHQAAPVPPPIWGPASRSV